MKNSVQQFDNEFKVIIVGSSGVGKSAILLRFADDKFQDDCLRPTIGVDFRFKTLDVDGRKIKIQIWDTAGQESFRTIVSAYYKGADAIIVVYDSSDTNTFTDVQEFWSNQINQNKEQDCVVMVLANKCDLPSRKPNEVRIQNIKKVLNCSLYFQVSAKDNENINLAFQSVCRQLLRKNNSSRVRGPQIGNPNQSENLGKKKCCQ